MSIDIAAVHHVTIGCAPGDLPALHAFYTGVLGLREGYRPALRHPGFWLYAGDQAIVHLNALRASTPSREGGPLDHVAFKGDDLQATRSALLAARVPFRETPLAGTTLHQVFVEDPLGLSIELNFDLADEAQRGSRCDAASAATP